MSLLRHADFDYGNTRLRALRSELLRDSDYEGLLGEDIHSLFAAMGGTRYAPDVEVALPLDGLQSLHTAIRVHLGRSLEQMRSFYAGRARGLIDALLSRFDVHNVIAVLRSRSRSGITAEETLAALIPLGWLTESVAREILRSRELAGVVDLLAHRTPDRGQAVVLRSALGEYQRSDSVAGLERAVLVDHAARLVTTLGRAGPAGETLRGFVQRETDQHNLLVTLRLRDAIASGADSTPPPPETLLEGGTIPSGTFAAAVDAPAPAAILALVEGGGEQRGDPHSNDGRRPATSIPCSGRLNDG